MEYSHVKSILLDNKYISEIEARQDKTYNGKEYDLIVSCKLEVYGKWLPLLIGIPKNWEINLFDFYWKSDFPYIPHIDNNGKFCLYDLEGCLIDTNLQGLLNQYIDRTRELVKRGESGENKKDFLTEFNSYFCLLPNIRFVNCVIPRTKSSTIIKFYEKIPRDKMQKSSYFSSSEQKDFKTWGITETQRNGIYLYIEPDRPIYPPNYSTFNGIRFFNELLEFVDEKEFNKLKQKCKGKLFVIFEITQEIQNTICCGVVIESPVFMIEKNFKLVTCDKLAPLFINRIDTQYLTARTPLSMNKLADKTYLLIGCGSIGGYVFHNLIKSGCRNITVVDNDIMKAENIYRHFLGIESVGLNKPTALANYAVRTIPELNIKPVQERIETAIVNRKICLNDYDYIISATGNHNVNLWLNTVIMDKKIDSTVFYIWNEALDIGCHVAAINRKRAFDYRNLFGRDENGELFDLTSFSMKGQIFTNSYSGCGGTFIPYGPSISLKSALLFIDILKRDIEGQIEANILYSEKGDDFYFKKAGFKVSNRYKNQQDKCKMIKLEDLARENHYCE